MLRKEHSGRHNLDASHPRITRIIVSIEHDNFWKTMDLGFSVGLDIV